jgi:superfamily II DNA or RNA helicase
MKQAALKESEEKQIIIATYAMAAEALDIKTLTRLVMATPKTDVEQSVGRVLRDKQAKPTVIDVIDAHQVFQNQWRKRKTFYRSEKYNIIECPVYRGMPSQCAAAWTVCGRKRGCQPEASGALQSGKLLIPI